MARIIKVADAKGREHECILKIFVETFYLSDSSQGKHSVWIVFYRYR
jgi:hypothetical protein